LKDVTQKVNNFYQVVRETRDVNELEEELRHKFAKERSSIIEIQRQSKKELANKDAELEKVLL
jgi:nitrogen regulatory protein PII-like uncharacterized protein